MSTEFTTERPIYLQILDYCMDRISAGEWLPGERIPSVKELSATMTVNPRTVMKSYDEMTSRGMIFQRRGMGFYVADDAKEIADRIRWEEFDSTVLPDFISKLKRIGYPVSLAIEKIIKQTDTSGAT